MPNVGNNYNGFLILWKGPTKLSTLATNRKLGSPLPGFAQFPFFSYLASNQCENPIPSAFGTWHPYCTKHFVGMERKSLYTRNCEKKLGWTKELKMRQTACSWDRLCWLFPPACRIIELCDLVWQSHYLGDNNQGFTYPVKLVGVVVATQYTCDNMNFLYEATCCVHSFKG